MKITTKRLVIAVRNNKTYHYWREVKMIDRFGMFQVEQTHKDGTYDVSGLTIMYKKKVISDWNDIMNIIEALEVQRLREYKINNLLNV